MNGCIILTFITETVSTAGDEDSISGQILTHGTLELVGDDILFLHGGWCIGSEKWWSLLLPCGICMPTNPII